VICSKLKRISYTLLTIGGITRAQGDSPAGGRGGTRG